MAVLRAPRDPSEPTSEPAVGGPYASYVLGVLVIVYIFNFLDRQIISILAEEIRADLGLSDAEIGFLYGTAFAVFYAIFGIPLGRLADGWDRRRLISWGLAFWSAMTALSGLSQRFAHLAGARIGVGVGEASATPAAFSMLSDYFPPERRATVLALYSSGIYIGAGIGLFLGGWVVELWGSAYPDPTLAPLGLKGWQAAYLVVGTPGLLMALWVRSLREPVRGQSDRIPEVARPTVPPLSILRDELGAILPGLSLLHLSRAGASRRVIGINLAGAAGISALAAGLTLWLGTPAQWISLGVGIYCSFSWAQGLALRDRPSFTLIFQTPSLVYGAFGFSLLSFTGYGIGFFTPPFFQRIHGVSIAEAGTVLGLTAAIAGWLGVTLGGVAADALRRRRRNGRLWVGIFAGLFPLPFAVLMLLTPSTTLAYALNFAVSLGAGMWLGPGASTVQDLVLPRMRAVASAAYILVITFVGLALGPYTIGRLSVALDDLRLAMLFALLANLGAVAMLILASRHLVRDEANVMARAIAAGEPQA